MSDERFVKLTRDGDMIVVSDQDGEFARASSPHLALPYVADLLYGPGTHGSEGLASDLRPVARELIEPDWPLGLGPFGI